ncbi:hypothetical protein EHQ71_10660 [Leptospira levettii]|nr:hypothetical protein EHQ71_10660 [Leptospira levettii]
MTQAGKQSMNQLIILTILTFLFPLALFPDKQKGNGPIDFSKEQPVHPYYETLGGNGSLNCKEKQVCMSNCTSSVYVYTSRGKSLETARQGCITDCNRIVCLPENKK